MEKKGELIMDDFDLRDMLSPPLRHCTDGQSHPAPHKETAKEPMVLGMAYVRNQEWEDLYEPEVALKNGTIFRQLNYPFMGKGGDQR